MTLKEIQGRIKSGNYYFSEHAVKRMIFRFIKRHEIEETILEGQIIEKYPDDKYSPSCLVYGRTKEGRHLHVLVSLPPNIVIITTYEPNPDEWINRKFSLTVTCQDLEQNIFNKKCGKRVTQTKLVS